MSLVSVIIPVYNVAPYLRRCLDSVTGQTLRDIEIICIDDASTDASAAILAEYAARDSRVKVITFERNRGVSAARNAGLDVATGEWIGFVDGDDKIDLDFFEKLYGQASTAGVDVAKGKLRTIGCDGRITVSSDNEIIRKKKTRFAFLAGFGTAIYRRSVVKSNGIQFWEGCLYSEDVLFLNEFILHSQGLIFVDDVSYHYCKRENSATTTVIFPPEKTHFAINAFRRIVDNTLTAGGVVDDEGMRFVCLWFFSRLLFLTVHIRDEKSLNYCFETAVELYKKVVSWISEEDPKCLSVVLPYLKSGDVKGFCEFVRNHDTEQKLWFANLRYLQLRRRKIQMN